MKKTKGQEAKCKVQNEEQLTILRCIVPWVCVPVPKDSTPIRTVGGNDSSTIALFQCENAHVRRFLGGVHEVLQPEGFVQKDMGSVHPVFQVCLYRFRAHGVVLGLAHGAQVEERITECNLAVGQTIILVRVHGVGVMFYAAVLRTLTSGALRVRAGGSILASARDLFYIQVSRDQRLVGRG